VSAELGIVCFFACRKEALWLLNPIFKVVEKVLCMIGWSYCHVLSQLPGRFLYRHLPSNGQLEGCLQLHCLSFSLVVVAGMCVVLSLC